MSSPANLVGREDRDGHTSIDPDGRQGVQLDPAAPEEASGQVGVRSAAGIPRPTRLPPRRFSPEKERPRAGRTPSPSPPRWLPEDPPVLRADVRGGPSVLLIEPAFGSAHARPVEAHGWFARTVGTSPRGAMRRPAAANLRVSRRTSSRRFLGGHRNTPTSCKCSVGARSRSSADPGQKSPSRTTVWDHRLIILLRSSWGRGCQTPSSRLARPLALRRGMTTT